MPTVLDRLISWMRPKPSTTLVPVNNPLDREQSASPRVPKNPTPADIPQAWNQALFGPGTPIPPFGGTGRSDVAEHEPRSFQYAPNANSTISPRLAYGLTSFAELKYFSENVPEAAMCRRMLIDEMKNFIPQIVEVSSGRVVQKAQVVTRRDPDTGELRKMLTGSNEFELSPEMAWLTTRPDRTRPWPMWLSRFLYNVVVYDGGNFYYQYDDNGNITGLRVLDASTLFCLIDERGEQPRPPAPSIAQIIFGQPRNWYSEQQIWYQPRHLRVDSPYGITPVEDSMVAVRFLENLWQYEINFYTEGNLPEAYATAPLSWIPEQVLAWEEQFNDRMVGNHRERRRLRALPNGFKIETIKQSEWQEEKYKSALERVALAHGIHLSEIGQAPGEGLGGKGFQEKGEGTHYRIGPGPLKEYIEAAFTHVLRLMSHPDLALEMVPAGETLDPDREEKRWLQRWEKGLARRDEAREGLNMKPLGQDDERGDEFNTGGGAGADPFGMFGGAPATPGAPKTGPTGPVAESPAPPAKPVAEVFPQGTAPSLPPVSPAALPPTLRKIDLGGGGEHRNDAMIAVKPPPSLGRLLREQAEMLALPPGTELEPESDLHLTLFYFPEADPLLNRLDDVADCLHRCLAAPLPASVGGWGIFYQDEANVLWASVDCPGLAELRETIAGRLQQLGIPFSTEHGFTPHITLAWLPKSGGEIALPPLEPQVFSVNSLAVVSGLIDIRITTDAPSLALYKHCGVCEEDDLLYNAPITPVPGSVYLPGDYAPARLVKVMGEAARLGKFHAPGELPDAMLEQMGTTSLGKAEAFYLLDRALEFFLVPVTWRSTLDGEAGEVMQIAPHARPGQGVTKYAAHWQERCAVLEFVAGQMEGAPTWLSHPDDPTRPILLGGRTTFPLHAPRPSTQPWAALWKNERLSTDILGALTACRQDVLWQELGALVGEAEAGQALQRLNQLIRQEKIL